MVCIDGSQGLTATGRHLPYGITPATRQVNASRLNPSQQAGT